MEGSGYNFIPRGLGSIRREEIGPEIGLGAETQLYGFIAADVYFLQVSSVSDVDNIMRQSITLTVGSSADLGTPSKCSSFHSNKTKATTGSSGPS